MSKSMKSFILGMVIVSVVLIPACKHKPAPEPTPAPVVDTTPPPPVPTTTTVAPPTDFVKTDTEPTVETLPSDIDELNRIAQQRGYIQDAFFSYDESTLPADAQSALTNSASWLKTNSQYDLLIEGHCDERGTEQYNLALGDRRANTAKQYLVTLGIDAGRIRTVSYGEERPFDPGHNEAAWAKNRRAHLVLVGTGMTR